MTAIGPGTPLICVHAWPEYGLTEGALYTCDGVEPLPYNAPVECTACHGTGKALYYIRNRGPQPYCEKLFRPLNDGDTSLVETEIKNMHTEDVLDLIAELETIDE